MNNLLFLKLTTVTIVSLFLLSGCSIIGEKEITIPINDKQSITLFIKDSTLNKVNEQRDSFLSLVEEQSYQYEVYNKNKRTGKLTVTTRTLDNGDVFIFSKLENSTEHPYTANFSLQLDEINRYVINDFDQRYVEHKHDGTIGVDLTTYPIGLIEAFFYDKLNYQLIFSKNYLSKELTTTYENGEQSTLREFHSEEKKLSTSLSDDTLQLEATLQSNGEDISEGWVLFSNQPLFENRDNLQDWIDYHIDQYKVANAWLTAEGPFKKLPWSIEPTTQNGYGRNLGIMQNKKALDAYEVKKERYFYDLVLNSVADLMKYRAEKGTEIWETEYTSTWLKKPYGTTAPYIDTRHNENIALFLTRVGHLLNNKELLSSQTRYADYLIEQVEENNTIKINNGYLIADYFSPNSRASITHASLNHILGGMNFLLDSFIETGNKDYLEVAEKIHLGLEELGDKWIRESGDLWYQVNPDLSFTGNDYEQLTLIDLLNSQEKWEKAVQKRSAFLDKLIRSKTSYLVTEKKPIYDYVIDTLKEQGFNDILTSKYLNS